MSLPARSQPHLPAAGVTRSAMLMRALGARAASVWSSLSPQEAQALSTAMSALPENPDHEEQALSSYVQQMTSGSNLQTTTKAATIWTTLSGRDGASIANLVQDESPQIIAVILSNLNAGAAASTVRALPRSVATEVLKRLLSLGDIHPSAKQAIADTLERAISQTSAASVSNGHERVARIFDNLDSRSEEDLLTSLDTAEPGAAGKIRALMFTFEDLARLGHASLQTILASTDRAVLTVALKGADTAVEAAFFSNMTQRAGDLLRGEIAATGPLRRSEIDAARAEILTLARSLVKRGDILDEEADDELIE